VYPHAREADTVGRFDRIGVGMSVGRFYCKRAYWLMTQDLLVLTGQVLAEPVQPGCAIDLPASIRGPGLVPIHSIQEVTFADRPPELGVVIEYHHLEAAPMMEPSHLEGRELKVHAV
jgi:hypothetical protein